MRLEKAYGTPKFTTKTRRPQRRVFSVFSVPPWWNDLAQLRDDPERLLPAGDALAIVEGVAPALPVVVPGWARGVRAEDRVFQREQLVVGLRRLLDHDVEPGGHDHLVVERAVE